MTTTEAPILTDRNKQQTSMNYLELAHKIHQNAVDKGFWDEERPAKHFLMLAICELCEAIEADREGRRSHPSALECLQDAEFLEDFRKHVKDTLEDELADCVIRLLDLLAKICPTEEINITLWDNVNGLTLTEVAYRAADCLSDFDTYWDSEEEDVYPEMRAGILYTIGILQSYATLIGIDLDRHILLKMRYNASRPRLHGKKY